MLSALAAKAVLVPTTGLALAMGPVAAPPVGADGTGLTAAVRVGVSGGAFTANVGLVRTFARTGAGGVYCATTEGKPTPLTALLDANDRYGFGVRVNWDTAKQDYVVTNIHGDEATATKVWKAYVGKDKITTGPCGTAVKDGDKVSWKLEAAS
ncbi:hypothetical protein [Streptomyces sp. NPDC020742]|uniref:hypothetical protein n=1 Tax=unclassified Streptomyces TaxID=2593676 RepID=UPI0033C1698B